MRTYYPFVLFLLRLSGCLFFAYFLWRLFGAFGLVFAAPVFGIVLAKPIIEFVGAYVRTVRYLSLRHVNGRYYEFRGFSINISEDERFRRWVCVSDVRKVITGFPRDAVLLRQYPDGCAHDPSLPGLRIDADALLDYMQSTTNPLATKFKLWLRRVVVLPSERLRE